MSERQLVARLTLALQVALVNWSYEHGNPLPSKDPEWIKQVRAAFVQGRQYLSPELSYNTGTDAWKFAEWERTWGRKHEES